MKLNTLFALTLISILSSGCASLQSTSLSSIPAKREQIVSSVAGRTIILGFNFDNDFINTLEADLKRQCPGGEVRGILTKDEVINYFLYFVYKRKVTASGYCVGVSKS